MGVSITDREISSKKWAQSINRLPSLQHLILQDQLQRSSSGNIAEWYGDGIGNDPSSVNPPESHIYHAMLKLSSLKSFTQLSCRPLPAIVLFNKVHLERLNIMSPGLAPSKIALNKEDKLTGLRLLKMGTWLWPGEGDDNSCSAIGQSDWFTRNEHVWNFKTPVQGSIVPIEKYYGWAWHGANTCHVDDILAIAPGLRCLICDVDQFIFTGDSIPASLEHLVLAFRRVADYEPLLERFQRLVSRCKSMKTLSINVFSMWPGDSVRASMTTEVSANFRKFLHRLRIECGVHTRFIVNMPKEWRDMRETPVDPEGHIIQSGFFA
ncbi:hypothetical protein MMC25_007286 [Agyrium rufum]|nr:hypothetical protein [Agyrium rufum]